MSTYFTIQGFIKYPNKDSYNNVINKLESGGWVKKGFFVDEIGNKVNEESTEPDCHDDQFIIEIPRFHYRNLGYIDFFEEGVKGEIVGTCTDGTFEGWIQNENGTDNYDLGQWAIENMEDEDKFPPDIEDVENYCEWQNIVESEFFDEFS